MLYVRNLVREDAVIYWRQGSSTLQRKCHGWGRCTVAFKTEVQNGNVAPIQFRAVTRETSAKLLINDLPAILIKPSHYRDIIDVDLNYPGEGYCHASPNAYSFFIINTVLVDLQC